MKTGAERIVAERQRQISQEGWTDQHDDQHHTGELLLASLCYIYNALGQASPIGLWPWSVSWDKRKKHGCIRSLEIAGALIAAEIDRQQRQEKKETE